RLRVPGEPAERLRLEQPILKKLRRKLDKIPVGIGAGEASIGHVGQEAVQRVAKFMKQRPRTIKAEEGRAAGRRLGEIQHVEDDRKALAVEPLLPAEAAHPRTASLGGTMKIIPQKQRDNFAAAVLDLPSAYIRMVNGNAG